MLNQGRSSSRAGEKTSILLFNLLGFFLRVRHSGEVWAGLDSVAGVQKRGVFWILAFQSVS